MRSALLILLGLALLALAQLAVRQFTAVSHPVRTASWLFAALWLLISGWNLWNGVARAGYGLADELPIFALVFGLPVLAAAWLAWRAG